MYGVQVRKDRLSCKQTLTHFLSFPWGLLAVCIALVTLPQHKHRIKRSHVSLSKKRSHGTVANYSGQTTKSIVVVQALCQSETENAYPQIFPLSGNKSTSICCCTHNRQRQHVGCFTAHGEHSGAAWHHRKFLRSVNQVVYLSILLWDGLFLMLFFS